LEIALIATVRKVSEEESLIEVLADYRKGLEGIAPGDRLDVLYWMHQLGPDQRRMLKVHPRGDRSRPLKGVFGLRSPMRPNPIGVSTVRVLRIEQGDLYVTSFDAKDGSPVIDIKAGREDSP
jgi:L-fuculose-phosphate aldolase